MERVEIIKWLDENIFTKNGAVKGLKLDKFIPENILKGILNETKHIEKLQEKIYCYINEIKNKPKCAICNKQLTFKNFTIGYRKTCSIKCRCYSIKK